ncbi:translation initiation factor IF-2 associated domain-containing protein, partial [Xanthomonas phaseoli]
MSQQTTIRKLAELVNTPVDKLLVQLAEAGMKFSGPDQVVTSTEKMKLLGFLRRTHGKAETSAEAASEAAKKITLNRRKLQEVTVNAGRTKTTVNVEVRQKRTYVKSENEGNGRAAPMTPDEERADILRKLEESRQRNLEEQQRLAESDRVRDEAIQRKREEEQAAKDRAEAERKAAEEAAAAASAPAPVADAPTPSAAASAARSAASPSSAPRA